LNGNVAEDTDGLNSQDWYVIDIPIYDETDQQNGANPGDTAVIHAYKDGVELSIIPSKSSFTVGESGSVTQFNIVINRTPTADAGVNQTVDEGDIVTLNGSNSFDPDTGIGDSITYEWSQTDGTSVTLDDPTAAQPTFTAPVVGVGGEALTFELTVTDTGGLQDDDTCIVNVSAKKPPVADAGPDQTVDEGNTVTLDGSGSTDPDNEIASYLWTQTDGTSVTLSDPTAVQPTFLPPPVDAGTTLTFQLTVEDSSGLQGTDDVAITIRDNGIAGFPDDVVTTTCATGESIGVAAESGGNCVSLTPVDPSSIADTTNRPEDLIYGLFDIRIKTDTPGSTVIFIFYLPSPAPEEYAWYKYSDTNGWVDFSANAAFNAARDQVSLTLVDGGAGDSDDDANGTIQDPSGLGYIASGPEPTPAPDGGGGGGGGGGCFISAAPGRF